MLPFTLLATKLSTSSLELSNLSYYVSCAAVTPGLQDLAGYRGLAEDDFIVHVLGLWVKIPTKGPVRLINQNQENNKIRGL